MVHCVSYVVLLRRYLLVSDFVGVVCFLNRRWLLSIEPNCRRMFYSFSSDPLLVTTRKNKIRDGKKIKSITNSLVTKFRDMIREGFHVSLTIILFFQQSVDLMLKSWIVVVQDWCWFFNGFPRLFFLLILCSSRFRFLIPFQIC